MPLPAQAATTSIAGQLVFLGTGTSVGVPTLGCDCCVCRSENPRNKRMRCALALGLPQGNLLIDTPPDLRTQLLREDIGLIHAVAYTHEHADHLFGLDDLRIFPYFLQTAMPLYCEPCVENRIRRSYDYAFDDRKQHLHPGAVPHLEIVPIGLNPFSVLGATILPIRLLHGRLPVLGFRIGDIAYCTDTHDIPEESWPRLSGLRVLILDCLRPRPHPTHLSLEAAVDWAQRIGAEHTYFTHISHELEHEATNELLPPGMELAYDGLRIRLNTDLESSLGM
jgi:phosphoribosyl 1,2-cyclic phosphate phosphodiesterase